MKRLKTNFMSPSTCPVMKHYGDEFSLLAHKWQPRKSHLSLYKLRCLPVLEASDYCDDLTDGKHLFGLYPCSRGKNRSRGRVGRGKWILQGNECTILRKWTSPFYQIESFKCRFSVGSARSTRVVLKVVKIIILNILSQYLRGACVKSVSFTIVFGLIETKQILRGDYPEVDI